MLRFEDLWVHLCIFLPYFSLSAQPVGKITYVIRVTFVRLDTMPKNESAINKYY
jgi:hypothetical protein